MHALLYTNLLLTFWCIYVIERIFHQRYADNLAIALEDAFPGELEVQAVADRGTTGRFEVTFREHLIHSKTTKGQGKCAVPEEVEAVVEKIREMLHAGK